ANRPCRGSDLPDRRAAASRREAVRGVTGIEEARVVELDADERGWDADLWLASHPRSIFLRRQRHRLWSIVDRRNPKATFAAVYQPEQVEPCTNRCTAFTTACPFRKGRS